MRYDTINNQLFIENRARFVAQMKPNSIAIFHSNDEMPRNGDANFPFRQNSDLLHLTGIDQELTVLVLFPDCPKPELREVLFVRKTNEHIAVWEGHKYTKEEAEIASGIKKIVWSESYDNVIDEMMKLCEHIYINTNENARYLSPITYRNLRFGKELQAKHPFHTYLRSAPIMRQLRMVKHPIEIELMQNAINITDKAFRRVLDFVKPNVWEHEIEAEITHEFLRNRATGHAYTPIIASGENANVLHYIDNNQQCKDGNMILFDFGAEYANYAADMSRTIPVNGKYTDRQKEVYNATLRVMKEATSMLVVGNNLTDYHAEVGKIMESELIGLGLLDKHDVAKQNPAAPLYKKYFMHGTSHQLGLDVHDLEYRYAKFESGFVFTCEPGIYIPEEEIGVRIENDILITDGKPNDLMKNIPVEVEEIEDLMNS